MRKRTLVSVALLGVVLPVWAGNGDWYTGSSAGTFSGNKDTPCSCGTIPGRLDYEGFEPQSGPGVKLTMEGLIKIWWDGEQYPMCRNTQVPGAWELT